MQTNKYISVCVCSQPIPPLPVLEKFELAAVEFRTVQLLDGVLHIAVCGKLHHPNTHKHTLFKQTPHLYLRVKRVT